MNGDRRRRALPLIAGMVLLMACGGEVEPRGADGGATMPAPEPPTTRTGRSANAAVITDACSLLPAAEVQEVVGVPVTDNLALEVPPALSQCNYASDGNPALVSVMLRRRTESQTAQDASESVRGTLAESGITFDDVPGLGDAAFWGSNQLHVFGDEGWYVIVTPDAAEGLSQARALAERALARLEGDG